MKRLIRRLTRQLGFEISRHQAPTSEGRVVSLNPTGVYKGNVLLSYLVDPFLIKDDERWFNSHSAYWECLQIAKTFQNLGYRVDVIDYSNTSFWPRDEYKIFISLDANMHRIARRCKVGCVKILHIVFAHWAFHNSSLYKRLLDVKERRGVVLIPRRYQETVWAIEKADYGIALGNAFTIGTYAYSKKPLYHVPVSTTATYPWPSEKDFEKCRYRFLWLGGDGVLHKGLDLVLEAFRELPQLHLTVCGPIENEGDFRNAFRQELYETKNIQTIGWVDVTKPEFLEIANSCIALVYPSCSEGGGGSVVTCMHAGLIPIVSYEASVDVNDFGFVLKDCTLEQIRESVLHVTTLPAKDLEERTRKSWEFARANHTRERFALEYQKVIEGIFRQEESSAPAT